MVVDGPDGWLQGRELEIRVSRRDKKLQISLDIPTSKDKESI